MRVRVGSSSRATRSAAARCITGPTAAGSSSDPRFKAVIAHPDVPAKPNENLLADFFLLERLPYDDGGETFFEGIQAVRPGSCLSVTPDATMSVPFWSFNPRAQTRFRTHGDYAQRLRELLIAAVQRRLRTLHPVVVATSGGLDSAIVLSLADDLCKSGAASVSLLPVSYAAVR